MTLSPVGWAFLDQPRPWPTDLPTGQFDGGNSSGEGSSSKVTLVSSSKQLSGTDRLPNTRLTKHEELSVC